MSLTSLSLVLFMSWSVPIFAAQIRVENPCAGDPWLDADVAGVEGQSVGSLTIEALERFHLPFSGQESNLSSIRSLPRAEHTLEVINATDMRAYGWCFHVNGVEPAVMPDQVKVTHASDRITWFLAYAEMVGGTWVSMCNPTHESLPSFICGEKSFQP